MKLLLVALLLTIAPPLCARTFTSANGKRTIEAEFISYNVTTGTVVMKIDGSHSHTSAAADTFSQADREFFLKHDKELKMRTALTIETAKNSEDFKTSKGSYTYDKKRESFTVRLKNTGDYAFEDLTAKYDIYFSKFDQDGSKTTEVASGENHIETLAGNGTAEFVSDSVEIIDDCSSRRNCPKCFKRAAAVKSECVIGIRVNIYTAEDELITQYFSSNPVRALGQKVGKAD